MNAQIMYECDPWQAERREYWASEVYASRYKPLIRFLYRHHGRPFKAADLVRMFGFKGVRREISKAIEFARAMGHPIIGTQSGYHMATKRDEVFDFRCAEDSKAKKGMWTRSRMYRFNRLNRQAQLDLFSNFNRKVANA